MQYTENLINQDKETFLSLTLRRGIFKMDIYENPISVREQRVVEDTLYAINAGKPVDLVTLQRLASDPKNESNLLRIMSRVGGNL